jgi:hypothetical protein
MARTKQTAHKSTGGIAPMCSNGLVSSSHICMNMKIMGGLALLSDAKVYRINLCSSIPFDSLIPFENHEFAIILSIIVARHQKH